MISLGEAGHGCVVEGFDDEILFDVVDAAAAGSEPDALVAEWRRRDVPIPLTEESERGESTERRTDDDSDADEDRRDARGGGGGGCLTARFFGLGGFFGVSFEGSFWGPLEVFAANEDLGDLNGSIPDSFQNLRTRSKCLSSSLEIGGASGGGGFEH